MRDYKARFVISQIGMLIAAVCIVTYASLISKLVDEGMVAGDQQAAIDVGIWMLVLAIAMGVSIAVAGSQAVFFSQGVAFYVRRELYNRVQGYSFENFDHRPTSDLMTTTGPYSARSPRTPQATRRVGPHTSSGTNTNSSGLVTGYIAHHNQHRPHQSPNQRPPTPPDEPQQAARATVAVLRTSRTPAWHETRPAGETTAMARLTPTAVPARVGCRRPAVAFTPPDVVVGLSVGE